MSTITKTDLIILDRFGAGVDWGRPRRLLIERRDATGDPLVRLWIRPGHTTWGGLGMTHYVPTHLLLWTRPTRVGHDGMGRYLAEGRITSAVFAAHRETLVAAFGHDLPEKINPRETLIITEG